VHPGQQGTDLTAKVNGHLDYLSQLATRLGVHDPVETYLVPVLGKWNDLHDEATKWRTAAKTAADITSRLTAPLGGLDAAWQGADANSFLDYMQNVGLAGHDLSDALTAMADALDKTATGLHQIASELTDLLTETAEHSSDAMAVPIAGESRARQYLDEISPLLPAAYWREALARCPMPTVFLTGAGHREARATLAAARPLLAAEDR